VFEKKDIIVFRPYKITKTFVAHNSWLISLKYSELEEDRSTMKMNYQFGELSREEKEYHEMILLEEIDLQSWYAIAYSSIFGEEVFLTIQ
jgi:hypothetical protein